jgi:hypothetical protein
VTLAFEATTSGDERALVDQLLERGTIAPIITCPTWAVTRLTSWLDAEITDASSAAA